MSENPTTPEVTLYDPYEDEYMHMSDGEYYAAAHAEAIRNGAPCPFDCAACDTQMDDPEAEAEYEARIEAEIAAEEERIENDPSEWEAESYLAMYDDDPNPYHGNYYESDDLPF